VILVSGAKDLTENCSEQFIGTEICVFFLKVIDNTIIVREGRNFCKLTILEDCNIKYKALHNLERLMKGDFQANTKFVVSRLGHVVTFFPLSQTHQTFHVTVTENIVDTALQDDLLFLLHETSVSVYDLRFRKWKDRILIIAPKLVAIEANEVVIIILDTSNTLHVLNLKGILSCSKIPEDPQTSLRLPFPASLTSYPSISLNKTSLTVFNYNLDQCLLYSLWPHKN